MPSLALISPKGAVYSRNEALSMFMQQEGKMRNIRNLWASPNLGLLTIAALTPDDWDITYLDEHVKPIDFNKEYDIVGLSCMTQQVERGYEIAEIFKAKGSLTVMGGIHVTVCPDEPSKYVDVVIVGEAELTWPQLLKDWTNGNVKKMYKEVMPGTLDMMKSPMPKYHLIRDYDYNTITVHTSRGCPHRCSFCAASTVYGPIYRRKSNEQILEELDIIKAMFPKTYILFGDDNIFVARDESKDLLREMKELDIRWAAQTDISIARDEELLQLMVDAGCQWVVIGLESIRKESLKNIDNWKYQQVETYKADIDKIQLMGIGVMGAFVFGLDDDDYSAMEDTINFIDECNLYGIHVTSPTPFPGSKFRSLMKEENRLIDLPWSYYTHWDLLIHPKLLTAEEVQQCILKIYQAFVSEEGTKKRFLNFIRKQRLVNRVEINK